MLFNHTDSVILRLDFDPPCTHQFNFYDHTKLIITNHGHTLTFIDPSFTLTTYSLSELFHIAAEHGHYSSASAKNDERGDDPLERVRFLLGKVEYCKDVLRTLSQRKAAQQAQKDAAAQQDQQA